MKRNRNRLLILLAVLTLGVAPFARTAYAWQRLSDPSPDASSYVGPYSGEPDTPNTKTTTTPHTASSMLPSDGASSGVTGGRAISPAMWVSSVIRIWAATHLGVGQ